MIWKETHPTTPMQEDASQPILKLGFLLSLSKAPPRATQLPTANNISQIPALLALQIIRLKTRKGMNICGITRRIQLSISGHSFINNNFARIR